MFAGKFFKGVLMKKRFLSIAVILLLFITFTVLFAGCESLSEEEKEVVGIYELFEISIVGYPSIIKIHMIILLWSSNQIKNVRLKARPV